MAKVRAVKVSKRVALIERLEAEELDDGVDVNHLDDGHDDERDAVADAVLGVQRLAHLSNFALFCPLLCKLQPDTQSQSSDAVWCSHSKNSRG